eukprot:scaffold84995_cov20-Tisochrysis_lutea.AAC.2
MRAHTHPHPPPHTYTHTHRRAGHLPGKLRHPCAASRREDGRTPGSDLQWPPRRHAPCGGAAALVGAPGGRCQGTQAGIAAILFACKVRAHRAVVVLQPSRAPLVGAKVCSLASCACARFCPCLCV